MAIYHCSVQVISRGAGRSVCAAAAYRAADIIENPLTGEVHDFTRKEGVVHSEILVPPGAENLVPDRAGLWRRVEMNETRKDAQLAREFEVSLPIELDHEAHVRIVRDWANEQLVARGMIVDFSIHRPDGASENPHAHILATMREIKDGKFGNKVREWNSVEQLEQWRETWATAVNRELELAQVTERIDHRSHRERGIEYEPSKHLGPDATELERRGVATFLGDFNRAVAAEREALLELAALRQQQKNLTPEQRDIDDRNARWNRALEQSRAEAAERQQQREQGLSRGISMGM